MSGTGNLAVVSVAQVPSARMLVPRIEKVRADKGLHNDTTNGERFGGNNSSAALPLHASQTETSSAPRRHTPRHSMPFMAQILGQMLAQNAPDSQPANAAYVHILSAVPQGILLDQRV